MFKTGDIIATCLFDRETFRLGIAGILALIHAAGCSDRSSQIIEIADRDERRQTSMLREFGHGGTAIGRDDRKSGAERFDDHRWYALIIGR